MERVGMEDFDLTICHRVWCCVNSHTGNHDLSSFCCSWFPLFHMPQHWKASGIDPKALSLIFIHAEKDDYNARGISLSQKQILAMIRQLLE